MIKTRQVRSLAAPIFFFAGDMTGILPKSLSDAYPVAAARAGELGWHGSGGTDAYVQYFARLPDRPLRWKGDRPL
jgi:hypothetical protein